MKGILHFFFHIWTWGLLLLRNWFRPQIVTYLASNPAYPIQAWIHGDERYRQSWAKGLGKKGLRVTGSKFQASLLQWRRGGVTFRTGFTQPFSNWNGTGWHLSITERTLVINLWGREGCGCCQLVIIFPLPAGWVWLGDVVQTLWTHRSWTTIVMKIPKRKSL